MSAPVRTEEQDIKPGDWLIVNGRRAVAVHRPQVVVLYEDLGIAIVPIGAVKRSPTAPDIKSEEVMRARDRWPEVEPRGY